MYLDAKNPHPGGCVGDQGLGCDPFTSALLHWVVAAPNSSGNTKYKANGNGITDK